MFYQFDGFVCLFSLPGCGGVWGEGGKASLPPQGRTDEGRGGCWGRSPPPKNNGKINNMFKHVYMFKFHCLFEPGITMRRRPEKHRNLSEATTSSELLRRPWRPTEAQHLSAVERQCLRRVCSPRLYAAPSVHLPGGSPKIGPPKRINKAITYIVLICCRVRLS